MKKTKLLWLTALVAALGLSGCKQEEIVFDNEQPQFEIRQDAILIEVISPQETGKKDVLYIAGPFNGGDETALKNDKWQLIQSEDMIGNYGIYLNPADFVDGKTLADGFHFINQRCGIEKDLKGASVERYDNPQVGTRLQARIEHWASFFEGMPHNGYTLYVLNDAGWSDLYLYAWSDSGEPYGGWPGTEFTGKETIGELEFFYFDFGADMEDQTISFIIDNGGNGAGNQLDGLGGFKINRNVYMHLVDENTIEEIDKEGNPISGGGGEGGEGSSPFHPLDEGDEGGHRVYVDNQAGWKQLGLHAWTGSGDLFGGWPGLKSAGTEKIGDITFTYFDLGKSTTGKTINIIIDNGNGGDGNQVNGPGFTVDHDIYLRITTDMKSKDDNAIEIDKDGNPIGGDNKDDNEDPNTKEYKIYITDNTAWTEVYIYTYKDDKPFNTGAWPGLKFEKTENVDGIDYKYVILKGNGENCNTIFNNNSGTQFNGPQITMDKDYFFEVTATTCTEITK